MQYTANENRPQTVNIITNDLSNTVYMYKRDLMYNCQEPNCLTK